MDRELLTIYLTDHLAGASGAVRRLDRMAKGYTDLTIHPELVRLASEVRQDGRSLLDIVHQLGLPRRRPKQAVARVGELAGRLKLNGRVRSRSPLTPLIELEAMQVGVRGKLSLWRTLQEYAEQLALEPSRLSDLEQRAQDQLDVLDRCHAAVTRGALSG